MSSRDDFLQYRFLGAQIDSMVDARARIVKRYGVIAEAYYRAKQHAPWDGSTAWGIFSVHRNPTYRMAPLEILEGGIEWEATYPRYNGHIDESSPEDETLFLTWEQMDAGVQGAQAFYNEEVDRLADERNAKDEENERLTQQRRLALYKELRAEFEAGNVTLPPEDISKSS